MITGWVRAVYADAEPLPRLPSRACRRLMKMVFQGAHVCDLPTLELLRRRGTSWP